MIFTIVTEGPYQCLLPVESYIKERALVDRQIDTSSEYCVQRNAMLWPPLLTLTKQSNQQLQYFLRAAVAAVSQLHNNL